MDLEQMTVKEAPVFIDLQLIKQVPTTDLLDYALFAAERALPLYEAVEKDDRVPANLLEFARTFRRQEASDDELDYMEVELDKIRATADAVSGELDDELDYGGDTVPDLLAAHQALLTIINAVYAIQLSQCGGTRKARGRAALAVMTGGDAAFVTALDKAYKQAYYEMP